MNDFQESNAAAERRLTWLAIKRSDLNNNQKEALRYLVNLWFYHRGQSGVIHPGVEKLGKKAGFSHSTGERCLRLFRQLGFIKVQRYAKGGTGCATQYTLSVQAIWAAYLPPAPIVVDGNLVEFRRSETPSKPRQNPVNAPANPVKMTHCLKGPMGTHSAVVVSGVGLSLDEMERSVWGTQEVTCQEGVTVGAVSKAAGGHDA